MIKLLSNQKNKLINLIIFLLIFLFLKNIHANELRPLKELLNENRSSDVNSLITMNRCAAIYGALYFINPSDTNSKEYENRYKIFLQSAVLEDIKIYNTNEEESYKNHIEEFKSSIKFFIQIYLQNYKKNNSYLKNHWLENDFIICEKL